MASREIRPIQVIGQVAYVPLTKGYTAKIDAADVRLVEGFNWLALIGRTKVYAVRSQKERSTTVTIYMHRLIADAPADMHVDHINGDGLDNTKANLRLATPSQNARNRGKQPNNTSGFKGVFANKSGKPWCAKIRIHGKSIHLGSFDTREAASSAYCSASARIHGEFGRHE